MLLSHKSFNQPNFQSMCDNPNMQELKTLDMPSENLHLYNLLQISELTKSLPFIPCVITLHTWDRAEKKSISFNLCRRGMYWGAKKGYPNADTSPSSPTIPASSKVKTQFTC